MYQNIWIKLFKNALAYLSRSLEAFICLLGGKNPENKNQYEGAHFILQEVPEFWAKKPTGVGLGRSIIISFVSLFLGHEYFQKK